MAYPKLKEIEDKIKTLGINQVFMSGSGSTLFLRFKTKDEAFQQLATLKSFFPDFFVELSEPTTHGVYIQDTN